MGWFSKKDAQEETEKNAGVNPPNTSTERPPKPGGSEVAPPPKNNCPAMPFRRRLAKVKWFSETGYVTTFLDTLQPQDVIAVCHDDVDWIVFYWKYE